MSARNHASWAMPAAILLLAPFNILASLAMDIYLPVVHDMPAVLDTTPAVVQLTLTLYMIMLGVGQIAFGPLSDRFGRRPVLLGGVLLFALASLALAFTTSAAGFVLLRLVQAAAASAMLVALFATVRDVYGGKPESVAVYGLLNALLACVPALGPLLGAAIVRAGGWQAIFVALAMLALAAALFAWPRWHETRPASVVSSSGGYRAMLVDPAFWTYTLGFSAAMGAFFVFFSIAPRVLIAKGGFSDVGFSLAFATVAMVMMATARAARSRIERWGVAGSVMRGMALLLLGAGASAIGAACFLPSFWSFVLPMWITAVGIVVTASVTANGALAAFAHMAGRAAALHFCVQSLVAGVVGTLVILRLDGDTAWPLVAYIVVMAALTLVCLHRNGKTAHPA